MKINYVWTKGLGLHSCVAMGCLVKCVLLR